MSIVPDSTTDNMDQADGITQQLAEAMLEDRKKEEGKREGVKTIHRKESRISASKRRSL